MEVTRESTLSNEAFGAAMFDLALRSPEFLQAMRDEVAAREDWSDAQRLEYSQAIAAIRPRALTPV